MLRKHEGFSISTHSRAKAAGRQKPRALSRGQNFNSQPREGGWVATALPIPPNIISTHSRAKAAG